MPIFYKDIKPWGRSLDEYTRMFGLSSADLDRKILGCGDGPAAFNASMKQQGKSVCSIDPIYHFSREELEKRIAETYEDVIEQTRNNQNKFLWTTFQSVDELGRVRMDSMKIFLTDYEAGKAEGRYIAGELPALPFRDREFSLALCSHFLFLYTDNLSFEFHMVSILELLRVAEEVRIFPLLDANANRSAYADRIVEELTRKGFRPEEVKVNYEFQRGGNKMLRITHPLSPSLSTDKEGVKGIA